jgi:hypothetical protein
MLLNNPIPINARFATPLSSFLIVVTFHERHHSSAGMPLTGGLDAIVPPETVPFPVRD